ncbi:MAG: helix-turn-helix transcriptional regulator [bacterium]|nr:helix-turn-helix transcriptional regulator [bacterium]MDO5569764.1 helix-turn-helix transcriptional regulator [bacterium]
MNSIDDNNLANIRQDADLSQREVAEILKVSKTTYGRWEVNDRMIPLKHLKNFSDYFEVSYDYIFNLSRKNCYSKFPINKKKIGERLKQLRKDKGLTQEKLANKLNTTHSTISAYENGKTLILTVFAYQIAKEYKVSMDYLCGRDK